MSIHVVVIGTLLAKPEPFDSRRGDVVAGMIGTQQEVHHHGRVCVIDTVPTAELVCIDELASELLRFERGDRVEVRGRMTVSCQLEQTTNPFATGRVSFHGESISRVS